MVSNSLDMALDDLLGVLKRLKRDLSDTKEYQELRRELPNDWPM